jgi:transposase
MSRRKAGRDRLYTSPCENSANPVKHCTIPARLCGRIGWGGSSKALIGSKRRCCLTRSRTTSARRTRFGLAALGFDGVIPEETGRPSYHPATLLKIYLYGYLNQMQSSRGHERECHRNLELIWLTARLAPDFKTIADFRRDNGLAIRKVCAQFVALCRNLHLLDVASVAIDGSKFKAVNHREKNFTQDRLTRRMAAIEGTIDRYLAELDRTDRQHEITGVAGPAARVERLKRGIATLKQKLKGLGTLDEQMRVSGEQQISLTDPDARAMTSKSHSAYVVGYNVQSAVDTQNHLIVAHKVSNVDIDTGHLSSMANQARAALEAGKIEVLADRGYFKSEEIAACEEAGIEAYVPKRLTSNARAEGRCDRRDFVYERETNSFVCPAGERLTYRMTTTKGSRTMHCYWTSVCGTCALKQHCTPGLQRRVERWEHEDVLDRAQERLDRRPDAMIVRRPTVEHPFASIKAWMGATHFRMKTLKHVATEMALHVLAYNLKRVMAILGVRELLKAI